jgi:hypothetical protein
LPPLASVTGQRTDERLGDQRRSQAGCALLVSKEPIGVIRAVRAASFCLGFLAALVGIVVVLTLIGGCFLLAFWTMESWHNYWLSSLVLVVVGFPLAMAFDR